MVMSHEDRRGASYPREPVLCPISRQTLIALRFPGIAQASALKARCFLQAAAPSGPRPNQTDESLRTVVGVRVEGLARFLLFILTTRTTPLFNIA